MRRLGAKRGGVLSSIAVGVMICGYLFGATVPAFADDSSSPSPVPIYGQEIVVLVQPNPSSSTGTPGSTETPYIPTVTSTGQPALINTVVDGALVVAGDSPSSPPATTTSDEVSVGGVFYVSGVTASSTLSLNPFGGDEHAQFSVRNVTTSTLDATASFHLTNIFGAQIGAVENIPISQLKPGESRVVEAVLPGMGQWTFGTVSATFIPPESVGGATLTPVTRDTFVFVLPWLVIAVIVIVVGVFVTRRFLRGGTDKPALEVASR